MIDAFLFVLLVLVAGLIWWSAGHPRLLPGASPAAGPPSLTYYWKLSRQAGFSPDGTWRIYIGAKIALAAIVPLLVAAPWDVSWWVLALAAAIGSFLPDAALARLRRKRQEKLRRALSFFLDLLVSLLGAGLGLDEAFNRAARAGLPKGHPLAEEIAQVISEVDLGRERGLGLQALADRTGLAELRGLASALQLSFSLGASVETTLKAQAELVRAKRREESLKHLSVLSAEVLLPLVLCTFPVFLVLVVVPLGIMVLQSLAAFRAVLR